MNINPLLTFLEVCPPDVKPHVYAFCDRMKECGYEVPSGKGLRLSFERRQKREAIKEQQRKKQDGT
jgi:hypothetical protein